MIKLCYKAFRENQQFTNYHVRGVGNIHFKATTADGFSIIPFSANKYRHVIIPGGTSIGNSKAQEED